MGLGTAVRGMATALEAARIPFNAINLRHGTYHRQLDRSWLHREARRSQFDVTIVCVNPDNSFHLRTQIPRSVLGERYVIGYWFWELQEWPDQWLGEFEFTDEVWAPSHFIRDAVSRKSPAPVVIIPPVVRLPAARLCRRKDFGLPERCYLFLAAFDTHSVLERKNPLGVLRAFQQAFSPVDDRVALVMKFNGTPIDRQLPILRQELQGYTNVFIVDRVMDRDGVSSLIRMADCFVSLHRSEGFGLVGAEAMSVGKPVILTNWSGNTDYMTSDNSIGIGYELVRLGSDYGPYPAHTCWAEPDIAEAAFWMRRLSRDSGLGKVIGERAHETIARRFSPEAVGGLIAQRLAEIRRGDGRS